ncbi:unnamed protein product [Owenia fusiformis]|uniref:Uncharacterized protein n=1 Tax=Owenia fusiformis TaxID=6347 RepID=A0A8J1UXF7_OWEFU|nr:unnamed protein product [Owenia fusiformis]
MGGITLSTRVKWVYISPFLQHTALTLGQHHIQQITLIMMFHLILLATALIIPNTEGVDVDKIKALYSKLPKHLLEKLFSNKKEDSLADVVMGRSGFDIPIPEGFFESQCLVSNPPPDDCADICFIIQTSCMENAGAVMVSIQRDINTIMAKLSNQSRFTIVTYSDEARSIGGWVKYDGAVDTEMNETGSTCDDCKAQTHKALQMCQDRFQVLEENDADVEKHFLKNIIIFTDGISFNRKGDMGAAKQSTINKALIIKATTQINMQVVKIITTQPGDDVTGDDEWGALDMDAGSKFQDVLNVNGLGVYGDQDVDIGFLPCGVELIEDPVCCTADVVFIIDQSNSIKKKDIHTLLEFFDDFVKIQEKILEPGFIDRTGGLQIALITYGGSVTVWAHLGDYGKAGLINVISKIPRKTTKYTHTHEALDAALEELQTYGRTTLNYVRKIVVIATDGRTWMKGDKQAYNGNKTIDAAKRIKDYGGEIYLVGLPNYKGRSDGYEREWKYIATEPKDCTIVNMQKPGKDGPFTDLEYVGLHLTKEICYTGPNVTCPWRDNP